MGIELQGVAYGVHPGGPVTFSFNNPVQAYVLGIWAFTLTFGPGQDHWLNEINVHILPGQETAGAAVTGKVVDAIVKASMSDSSGHNITSASILYPVCLAVTGTIADAHTVLVNVPGIASKQSAEVSLPASGSAFSVLQSCLSGFDLEYKSGSNQLLGAQAAASITYNGAQGYLASLADYFDGKAHHVDTATIDAGVIGSVDASPGFAVQEVTDQTTGPVQVTFPTLTSISSVMVFLRSWQVQYDKTRSVQTLMAGSFGPPTTIVGNIVTLPNLYASVYDKEDHLQDDSQSSATVLVVALP